MLDCIFSNLNLPFINIEIREMFEKKYMTQGKPKAELIWPSG